MVVKDQTLFQLSGCDFSYRGYPCLRNVDLTIKSGRFYGLIGPNGSGKTTLINLLTGSTRPTTGTITLYGENIYSYAKPDLARLLSLVPQNFSMEFEYTVFEVVMMGRHPFIGRFGSPSIEDKRLVASALETLDILHLQDRYVTRLSGGERQRVLVARALAQNSGIMVLDEATASLDVRHSIDIMIALNRRVSNHDVTVIAAIHDLDLAAAFCDELIVMQDGQIHTTGTVQEILTADLLQNIFSVDAEIIHTRNHTSHIHYRYGHEN